MEEHLPPKGSQAPVRCVSNPAQRSPLQACTEGGGSRLDIRLQHGLAEMLTPGLGLGEGGGGRWPTQGGVFEEKDNIGQGPGEAEERGGAQGISNLSLSSCRCFKDKYFKLE